mmetsp:Transcript_11335/g.16758  ORF Transcript_11335/g.16758 Transcript_11335/m.16758 type:complete len:102 (-) Transcript_11335:42-347(-)
MNYFKTFSPNSVEWINDSSCNVVFPSSEYANAALTTCAVEEVDDQNKLKLAVGYESQGKIVPLYLRYSTEGDKKPEASTKSKYYEWKRNIRNKPISRKKKN